MSEIESSIFFSPVEQLQNAGGGGGHGGGQGYGGGDSSSHVLKMRGMPFSATEQDVVDFLEGRTFDLSYFL